jgi:hypothetical protein
VDVGLAKRDGNKETTRFNATFRPPSKSDTGWSKTEIIDGKAWRKLFIKNNPIYNGYKGVDGNKHECWSYPKNQTIDHITRHKNNYTITFKNFDRIKIVDPEKDQKQDPEHDPKQDSNSNLDPKLLRKVKDILNETM